MTNNLKTKSNTKYHIEKHTSNIIEITTCNGYVSTNTVYYTTWNEDENELLKQFENKLQEV